MTKPLVAHARSVPRRDSSRRLAAEIWLGVARSGDAARGSACAMGKKTL
jgi:hypothetical protein